MSIFLERYALLKLTQEGRENMNRSKIKDLVSKENTYLLASRADVSLGC